MTQKRTLRADLDKDNKDNKALADPWYHHRDKIIYYLVFHKAVECENLDLVAMESDEEAKIPMLPLSPLLITTINYTFEVLRFLRF